MIVEQNYAANLPQPYISITHTHTHTDKHLASSSTMSGTSPMFVCRCCFRDSQSELSGYGSKLGREREGGREGGRERRERERERLTTSIRRVGWMENN